MRKAILVMDMPTECCACRFNNHTNRCHAIKPAVYCNAYMHVGGINGRPDWCPLRELPKKKPTIGKESDNDILCMNDGYNACIDELLKGEEG